MFVKKDDRTYVNEFVNELSDGGYGPGIKVPHLNKQGQVEEALMVEEEQEDDGDGETKVVDTKKLAAKPVEIKKDTKSALSVGDKAKKPADGKR